jgi:hypothetical protein
METLTNLEFLKQTPKVVYELLDYKLGYVDENWEFRWDGIFGKGYYQLTKNGRRHPQGNFRVTQQIYRDYQKGNCKIKNDGKI